MSVLVDNNISEATAYSILGDAAIKIGQSFSNSYPSCNISSCKFYLGVEGSIVGNVTASLFAHDGTYGSSSVATGVALATSSEISVSVLSATPSFIEFTFVETYAMVAYQKYVIVLEYDGSDQENYVFLGRNTAHGGNGCYYSDFWGWEYNNSDYLFYVYGNAAFPTISNISQISGISSITF